MRYGTGSSQSSETAKAERIERLSSSGASWTLYFPPKEAVSFSRAPLVSVVGEDVEGTQSTCRFNVPKDVAKALLKQVKEDGVPTGPHAMETVLEGLQISCAAKRLTDLVNRRDYATKEAQERLQRAGYSASAIEDVVERATRGHLLDDDRFAETFIRTKISIGWGRGRIKRELARRGISAESVSGWPEEYFAQGEELERAWELVARKPVSEKNGYQKLVRFLVSRGFDYGIARQCASRRVEEESEE